MNAIADRIAKCKLIELINSNKKYCEAIGITDTSKFLKEEIKDE